MKTFFFSNLNEQNLYDLMLFTFKQNLPTILRSVINIILLFEKIKGH